MKFIRYALLVIAASCSADIIPPVKWDVETGRLEPKPYALSIRRGESIDVMPRFLSYTAPINISGATIEMRYSTAYDSVSFYSVAGSTETETGRVKIAWSDSLNPTNSSMVYEIRATSGTNILARSYGPLTFLGGMVGINTGLTARTSIDWATVSQSGGYAVLSNQMGSGATWNGSQWVFGAGADNLAWQSNAVDSIARSNIVATSNVLVEAVAANTNFATSAQGVLADSAVQHTETALAIGNSVSSTEDSFAQGSAAFAGVQSFAQGKLVQVGTTGGQRSFGQGFNISLGASEYGFAQGAAITAGSRTLAQGSVISAGDLSFAQGGSITVGDNSFAQGGLITIGDSEFAWNPDSSTEYTGHGPGSVSFNATNGMYLGAGGKYYGDGSSLSNITAAQVGAIATNAGLLGVVNGLSVRDPMLTLAVDGSGPYATITPSPAGQIEYWFSNSIVQYGTSAVVRLTAGTTNTPALNYICALDNGALTNYTAYPYRTGSGEPARAIMFEVFLMDTNSIANGTGYALRSWTDNVEDRKGLGRISWIGERVRRLPAVWESGAQLSLSATNATTDSYALLTAGVGWQMHSHTTPAITNRTSMWVINHTTGLRAITNLNQITMDANGVAILPANGDCFALNVMAFVESGISPKSSRIMLTLPTSDYSDGNAATDLANCIADSSAYDVTGVPVWMQGMTIRIGRIVVRRDSATTRTYWVYDRRGQPLGTAGGGASSSGESDPVYGAALAAGTILTNAAINGSMGVVSNGVAWLTGSTGSGVSTNWIDAMSIGVGMESVFPTYQIRTNANGSMPVLAWDKTVANSWAGPFVIVPASTSITTFWQGYHSTTGTTSIACRWRSGLNAWSAVATSAFQYATGSLTNLDTLTNSISGFTPLVPIEYEITTISTNSGTSAGYHYLKAWGWTP